MFQGEGYDCARDSFNGDGLWSNVAGQREWVESQMLEGLTLGLNPLLSCLSSVLPVLFYPLYISFVLAQVNCGYEVELVM